MVFMCCTWIIWARNLYSLPVQSVQDALEWNWLYVGPTKRHMTRKHGKHLAVVAALYINISKEFLRITLGRRFSLSPLGWGWNWSALHHFCPIRWNKCVHMVGTSRYIVDKTKRNKDMYWVKQRSRTQGANKIIFYETNISEDGLGWWL